MLSYEKSGVAKGRGDGKYRDEELTIATPGAMARLNLRINSYFVDFPFIFLRRKSKTDDDQGSKSGQRMHLMHAPVKPLQIET